MELFEFRTIQAFRDRFESKVTLALALVSTSLLPRFFFSLPTQMPIVLGDASGYDILRQQCLLLSSTERFLEAQVSQLRSAASHLIDQ